MTRPVHLDPRLAWCAPGERLLHNAAPEGRVCSTIGGQVTAPHRIRGEAPSVPGPFPSPRPLPTRTVAEGRFQREEWAHDPAVWAWAFADRPERLAIRLADVLTAGKGAARLLLSTRRLAVAQTAVPFTAVFETDVRHVRGVWAYGVLTSDGARQFLRADLSDGSGLYWACARAADQADILRTGLAD